MMLGFNGPPPTGGEPLSDEERAELAVLQSGSFHDGAAFLRTMALQGRPGAETVPTRRLAIRGAFVVDGREYSGWMNTDATRHAGCPACAALPGESCHTPKGRNTPEPHTMRLSVFLSQPGVKRSWFTNLPRDLAMLQDALEQAEVTKDAPVLAALRKRKQEIEAQIAQMDAKEVSSR